MRSTPWGPPAALAVLAAVAATLVLPPSAVADETYVIQVQGLDQGVSVQAPTTSLTGETPSGALAVTLPAAQRGRQTAPQCLPLPDVASRLCVGRATATDTTPPLVVTGPSELLPMLKDPAAQEALGWLELDGREALRLEYDVPADERIARYARPELRSYMTDRLLDMMDRYVYGQTLTSDEQRALSFVESTYQEREEVLARAAAGQLADFLADPCGYRPPTAPAVVRRADRLPVPPPLTAWCAAHPVYPQSKLDYVSFAPPLAPVDAFVTWGSYAAAGRLGLTAFGHPVVQDALAQTLVGTAASLGFARAVPATTYPTASIGSATAVAAPLARVLYPRLGHGVFDAGHVGAGQGSTLATAGGSNAGSSVAGTMAATAASSAVVGALARANVPSWSASEHLSVQSAVGELVTEAQENRDPLGLEPLRADLAGLQLNSALDPLDPPAYRDGVARQRLAALLTLMSVRKPDGSFVAEPRGAWKDALGQSPAVDRRWVVRVAGGREQVRDALLVPQQADADKAFEYASVRSVGGWFVVDTADTPGRVTQPQTELSFGYDDRSRADGSGTPQLVSRAPSTLGGLVVTDTAYAGGAGRSTRRTWITFKDATGRRVDARLQDPAPTYRAGPRPVAVGPMYARRPVMLRPNPVAASGQSLAQATAEDDYTYDWTVSRRNPATGAWAAVPAPDAYAASFVPPAPGSYYARVTMSEVAHPSVKKYGAVAFTVAAAPILSPVTTLQDNGSSRVELDLQLAEDVPSDTVHVDVTWPGTLTSPIGPTTSLDLACTQSAPLACTTQRTGPSDLLVHAVTPQTDLRQPVRLTVTSATGAVVERELFLGAGRPQVAAPPEGANAGRLGTVEVGRTGSQLTMPLLPSGQEGVQIYSVARLVPSAGGGQDFGLLDPTTGNPTAKVPLDGFSTGFAEVFQTAGSWFLGVQAVADVDVMGSRDFRFLVAQTNGSRQLVPVSIHVTPSAFDRRRGAVASTADSAHSTVADRPTANLMVIGGTTSGPPYAGRLCARLTYLDDGPTGQRNTWCGPLSDFYGADGTVRPFPYERLFPTGMVAGTYRMDGFLSTNDDAVDNRLLGATFQLTDADVYPAPTVWVSPVRLTGTAQVGGSVRARGGSVFPDTATLQYLWLRDGTPIAGATTSSYDVTNADRGHRLSLRVTADAPTYAQAVLTSPSTSAVRP